MPLMQMPDEDVNRQRLLDLIGPLPIKQVHGNLVLIGVYVRTKVTASGIHIPDETLKEDVYQGKTGLILDMGPDAFQDSDQYQFKGDVPKIGDWVAFRVGDAWQLGINKRDVFCRLIEDQRIAMTITRPDLVW